MSLPWPRVARAGHGPAKAFTRRNRAVASRSSSRSEMRWEEGLEGVGVVGECPAGPSVTRERVPAVGGGGVGCHGRDVSGGASARRRTARSTTRPADGPAVLRAVREASAVVKQCRLRVTARRDAARASAAALGAVQGARGQPPARRRRRRYAPRERDRVGFGRGPCVAGPTMRAAHGLPTAPRPRPRFAARVSREAPWDIAHQSIRAFRASSTRATAERRASEGAGVIAPPRCSGIASRTAATAWPSIRRCFTLPFRK